MATTTPGSLRLSEECHLQCNNTSHPQDTGKFKIEADSSDFAVGGTLSQLQGGHWKPIVFLSKSLLPAECNYEIFDKELLVIMICLDEWHHYVLSAME